MKLYTPRIKATIDFIYDFYRFKDIKTKDGLSTIFHLYEVASKFDNEEEIIVSLLHDYIEDGGTINELVSNTKIAITQDELFYIIVLSRNMNVGKAYREYIGVISRYPVASKIKIEDLKHNLRRDRLEPDSGKFETLFKRYEEALKFLEENTNE